MSAGDSYQPVEKLLRLLMRRQNSAQNAHLPYVNCAFSPHFPSLSCARYVFQRTVTGQARPSTLVQRRSAGLNIASGLKNPFDKLVAIVENRVHFPLFRGYTILVLGVGDLGASKNPPELIKTYALGSCVAVILIHPKTRVVGMVHVALPDSTINPQKARAKPGYFADTGIPALIREMMGLGSSGGPKQMVAKIAGGAKIMDPNNVFNIGNRNILAVKKILWKYGVGPRAEDVGGVISRTVTVSAKTGRVTLSSPGKEDWRL